MAATTQEEILSGILPNVIISKISLASSPNGKLIVTLNLIIKEILDNDLLGTWFDDINIKKYINIDIVQSTDAKITEALSFSNDMIQLCNTTRTFKPEDMKVKALSYITKESKLEELKKQLLKKTERKIISLGSQLLGTDPITRFSSYQDDSGNKIYEIPYRTTFDLGAEEVEHLAYFVVASIDLATLARDHGIDYDILEALEENGRVYTELVIDNFQTVGISYVYTDQAGDIWSGPIHQVGNVFKTGDDETPDSRILTKNEVSNTKIEDFRNIRDIEKRIYDFSKLEKSIDKNITKIQSVDFKSDSVKESVFSEIFTSRGAEGDVKFMFGIDFNTIMKRNSKMATLFESDNQRFKTEAIRSSKISSIKVLRRRVKNDLLKSNAAARLELAKFDVNEPDELVIMTSDESWKNFNDRSNQFGSLREVDIETGSEYEAVRYFTGTDKRFSEITDGFYQYVVEVQIEDGTIDFIKARVDNLANAKQEIQKYLNEVATPTMKKYLAENSNPHIESPDEYDSGDIVSSYGYDIVSNTISRQMVAKLNARYSGNVMAAPWVGPVAAFVDALDIFGQDTTSNEEKNTFIRTLYTYLSPQSANPSSILKIVEIYDYLLTVIQRSTDVTADISLGASSVAPAANPGSKSLRDLREMRIFSEVLDSNVSKNFGLDYLSTTSNTVSISDGLYTTSADTLYKRIQNETLKYFENEKPNLAITRGVTKISDIDVENNAFSFITPTRIDFSAKSVMLAPIPIEKPVSGTRKAIQTLNDAANNSISSLSAHIQTLQSKISNTGRVPTRPIVKTSEISGKDIAAINARNQEALVNSMSELLSQYGSVTIKSIRTSAVKEDDVFVIRDGKTGSPPSSKDSIPVIEKLTAIKPAGSITKENVSAITGFMQALVTPMVATKTAIPNRSIAAAKSLAPVSSDFVKNLSTISSKNLQISSNTAVNKSSATVTGFMKPISVADLAAIPNQIRGLITNTTDLKKNDTKPNYSDFKGTMETRATNTYTYEMIVTIEYMAGFEKDKKSGDIDISRAIWKTLDKKAVDSFVEGKELLCRLRPYGNTTLGITPSKDAHDNAYDKHFIVITKKIVPEKITVKPPKNVFVDDIIQNIQIKIPNIRIKQPPITTAISGIKRDIIVPELIEIVKIDKIGTRVTTVIDVKSGLDRINIKDVITPIVKSDISKILDIKTSNNITPVSSQIVVAAVAVELQNKAVTTAVKNNNPVPAVNITVKPKSLTAERRSTVRKIIPKVSLNTSISRIK